MKLKLYVLTCASLFNFMAFVPKFTVCTFAGSDNQDSTDGTIYWSEFKISSKLFGNYSLMQKNFEHLSTQSNTG